jgi:ABC-2 type transport system ATP-binding protein
MVALGTPTELKQNAMRGELVLIECEPLGRAVELLQSAPGVLDAAVFGSALHVVVENADKSIPQIRSYLIERGTKVSKVERIRASLEDVFVSLTSAAKAARN